MKIRITPGIIGWLIVWGIVGAALWIMFWRAVLIVGQMLGNI